MKKIISLLLIVSVLFGLFAIDFSSFAAAKNVTIKINVTEDYNTAAKMATLLNNVRAKAGIKKIKYNSTLSNYAMQRAAELSVYYGSTHKRPNGTSATAPKNVFLENIAYGQFTAQEVMNDWYHSTGHRKNMLNKANKSFGIGCVKVDGVYFWVQIFSKNAYGASAKKGVINTSRNIVLPQNKLYLFVDVAKDNAAYGYYDLYNSETGRFDLNYADFADGHQVVVRAVHIDDNSAGSNGFPVVAKGCFTYASSNPSVLSVNSTGLATIKKAGAANITAKLKNGTVKAIGKYRLIKNLDVKLNKASFVYNAKNQSPTATVYDEKGKLMDSEKYTVSYPASSVNPGKYYVVVTYDYKKVKKAFTIIPNATAIVKLTAGKKAFNAKWKKQATQTSGYQLQYATNAKYSGAKTVAIKNPKSVSKTITKLAGKKYYYVRVRTYKSSGGANYYSAWSATKKIKTK